MKKDLPMPIVIAVLVIVVLLVIGVYWMISNHQNKPAPGAGSMPPGAAMPGPDGMPMPGGPNGMPMPPQGPNGPQGAPQGMPMPQGN